MSYHQRYVTHDSASLSKLPPVRPYSHLVESLRVLVNDYEPSSAVHGAPKGLLTGPTSVAYLFLWLSKLYAPTPSSASDSSTTITALSANALYIADRSPSEWCRSYLKAAQSSHARHPPAANRPGGIQDEALAYAVVKAAYTGEQTYVDRALRLAREQLPVSSSQSASDPGMSSVDPALNEWLYGRAGTLYLLRVLAHWVPSSRPRVAELTAAHAAHIMSAAPWTWRGKPYLGAAHGDAGILAQLVLSDPALASALEPRIISLLDAQLPNGNWPAQPQVATTPTATSPHSCSSASPSPPPPRTPRHMPHDELIQFCHGAPGTIIALRAMRPHVSRSVRPRIDAAVAAARDCVWRRGLLTKEPNLCHGISGNALAMEGMGNEDEDGEDDGDEMAVDETMGDGEVSKERRREIMMRLATPACIAEGVVNQATFTPGSDAYGLLWGEAGRAWVWAVLDGRARGFIGFSDV